jgi:adenylate kinase
MLRDAMRQATPIGQRVAKIVQGGDLASDDLILEIVAERLAKGDWSTGCLFDGVPRTVAQAIGLDQILASHGREMTVAIEFVVPEDELVRRIGKRAGSEGRADDTPETVKHRLDVYRQHALPIIDYYRQQGILRSIEGVGPEEEVFGRIEAELPPQFD